MSIAYRPLSLPSCSFPAGHVPLPSPSAKNIPSHFLHHRHPSWAVNVLGFAATFGTGAAGAGAAHTIAPAPATAIWRNTVRRDGSLTVVLRKDPHQPNPALPPAASRSYRTLQHADSALPVPVVVPV